MRLLMLDLYKKKMLLNKEKKKEPENKKIEYFILLELKDKLNKYIYEENYEKVFIEVDPKYVSHFLNILGDKVLQFYDYEQVDKNKFIFYQKVLDIL